MTWPTSEPALVLKGLATMKDNEGLPCVIKCGKSLAGICWDQKTSKWMVGSLPCLITKGYTVHDMNYNSYQFSGASPVEAVSIQDTHGFPCKNSSGNRWSPVRRITSVLKSMAQILAYNREKIRLQLEIQHLAYLATSGFWLFILVFYPPILGRLLVSILWQAPFPAIVLNTRQNPNPDSEQSFFHIFSMSPLQGLVTVPFWEYWTSPYSSHYRPYT